MAQVSWPCGAAASAERPAPATPPIAASASRSRRRRPARSPAGLAGSRPCGDNPILAALDRDVLVRPGIGERRDQPEPRFANPRTDAVDEGELPDRHSDGALLDQLLHLLQRRGALGMVEFDCLLIVQLVYVGIAAINKGATLDGKGGQPVRGVAE